MKIRITLLLLFLLVIPASWLMTSCRNPGNKKGSNSNTEVNREDLIRNQQYIVNDENEDIDDYISRHNYKMTRTETGLRYSVYRKSNSGKTVRDNNVVSMKYEVSLLNGEEVYNSDSTGVFTFRVGKSDVASGLQEGVTYMQEGDQAIFIVPSHLAYGLTGDGDKIRQYETLVIHVNLLKVSE